MIEKQRAAPAYIQIERVFHEPTPPMLLHGKNIEYPAPGQSIHRRSVEIVGWCLGQQQQVIAVEVVHNEHVIQRVPIAVERPDIAEGFPTVFGAVRSGFCTRIGMLGPGRVVLHVQAVLGNQQRVPLGTLYTRCLPGASHRESPLVSVIIPCYGQSQFLGEAIESVLAQSYPAVECVVVDDDSPDNTSQVVARYPGVCYVWQPNQERSVARNTGIKHSRGDYLIFLDADDRLRPDAIETNMGYLAAHPECAAAAGTFQHITLESTPYHYQPECSTVESDHYQALLESCCIMPSSAILYQRRAVEALDGLRPALTGSEDYDLIIRLAQHFQVVHHPHVVTEYRRHGANTIYRYKFMLRDLIRMLKSHRSSVRWNRSYRDALHRNIRNHRERIYGRPLVEQTHHLIQEQQWRQAIQHMSVLLRYYPGGLVRLAQKHMHLSQAARSEQRSEQHGLHNGASEPVPGYTYPSPSDSKLSDGDGVDTLANTPDGPPCPSCPQIQTRTQTQPSRSYLVCSTSRVGSTLLCRMLEGTGVAGKPREFFKFGNSKFPRDWWNQPHNHDLWQHHLARYTSPNGIYGVKVHWNHLNTLITRVRQVARYQTLEPAHLVATLFPNPRYIWLRRRDKVRQAVSRCKALQTTIWISRTSREAREDPRFDFEQIETIVQQIEVWEAGWQTYFDTYNLDPLVLYYEDFVTALDTTLFTILDHLDIPFPPDMECPLPQTEKMADEMSEAWVQQYYAIKQSQTDRHLPDGCLRDKDLSPPLNGYTDSINVINEKA